MLSLYSLLILMVVTSCDKTEYFDIEQYEKMIYIVSGTNNVDEEEFSYSKEENVRYVSFSTSGSKPVEEDVHIELETDTELLPKFNKYTFDEDEEKFAKVLNPDFYRIESYKLTLKKGENTGLLPVYIKSEVLAGLSPDSIFMIPLSIKSVSAYKIQEDKRNVLMRIRTRNEFATTGKTTYYSLKGYRLDTVGTTYNNVLLTSTSKVMVPLSNNEVRIFIANNNVDTDKLTSINNNALRLKISEDGKVIIERYARENKLLEVQQLSSPLDEPNFPYLNIYDKERKRFMLYYRYRTRASDSEDWGRWYYLQEDLRRLE